MKAKALNLGIYSTFPILTVAHCFRAFSVYSGHRLGRPSLAYPGHGNPMALDSARIGYSILCRAAAHVD